MKKFLPISFKAIFFFIFKLCLELILSYYYYYNLCLRVVAVVATILVGHEVVGSVYVNRPTVLLGKLIFATIIVVKRIHYKA